MIVGNRNGRRNRGLENEDAYMRDLAAQVEKKKIEREKEVQRERDEIVNHYNNYDIGISDNSKPRRGRPPIPDDDELDVPPPMSSNKLKDELFGNHGGRDIFSENRRNNDYDQVSNGRRPDSESVQSRGRNYDDYEARQEMGNSKKSKRDEVYEKKRRMRELKLRGDDIEPDNMFQQQYQAPVKQMPIYQQEQPPIQNPSPRQLSPQNSFAQNIQQPYQNQYQSPQQQQQQQQVYNNPYQNQNNQYAARAMQPQSDGFGVDRKRQYIDNISNQGGFLDKIGGPQMNNAVQNNQSPTNYNDKAVDKRERQRQYALELQMQLKEKEAQKLRQKEAEKHENDQVLKRENAQPVQQPSYQQNQFGHHQQAAQFQPHSVHNNVQSPRHHGRRGVQHTEDGPSGMGAIGSKIAQEQDKRREEKVQRALANQRELAEQIRLKEEEKRRQKQLEAEQELRDQKRMEEYQREQQRRLDEEKQREMAKRGMNQEAKPQQNHIQDNKRGVTPPADNSIDIRVPRRKMIVEENPPSEVIDEPIVNRRRPVPDDNPPRVDDSLEMMRPPRRKMLVTNDPPEVEEEPVVQKPKSRRRILEEENPLEEEGRRFREEELEEPVHKKKVKKKKVRPPSPDEDEESEEEFVIEEIIRKKVPRSKIKAKRGVALEMSQAEVLQDIRKQLDELRAEEFKQMKDEISRLRVKFEGSPSKQDTDTPLEVIVGDETVPLDERPISAKRSPKIAKRPISSDASVEIEKPKRVSQPKFVQNIMESVELGRSLDAESTFLFAKSMEIPPNRNPAVRPKTPSSASNKKRAPKVPIIAQSLELLEKSDSDEEKCYQLKENNDVRLQLLEELKVETEEEQQKRLIGEYIEHTNQMEKRNPQTPRGDRVKKDSSSGVSESKDVINLDSRPSSSSSVASARRARPLSAVEQSLPSRSKFVKKLNEPEQ